MFLRDHRIACDQELKELIHERLANLAKNSCLGARFSLPIDVALILMEPYFSVCHSN
jgi:hypothetical protein